MIKRKRDQKEVICERSKRGFAHDVSRSWRCHQIKVNHREIVVLLGVGCRGISQGDCCGDRFVVPLARWSCHAQRFMQMLVHARGVAGRDAAGGLDRDARVCGQAVDQPQVPRGLGCRDHLSQGGTETCHVMETVALPILVCAAGALLRVLLAVPFAVEEPRPRPVLVGTKVPSSGTKVPSFIRSHICSFFWTPPK